VKIVCLRIAQAFFSRVNISSRLPDLREMCRFGDDLVHGEQIWNGFT